MENGLANFMTFLAPADWIALLLRLTVGCALLPFGIKKFCTRHENDKFPAVLFFSSRVSFYLAMAIETIASICMICGFFTRLAAIAGICNMGIATKVSKGPYFTSPALSFLLGFISILVCGPGKYSLDYLFF